MDANLYKVGGRIEEIDKEMLKVQEELLKVANAKKDFTDLASRVEKLRNKKEKNTPEYCGREE